MTSIKNYSQNIGFLILPLAWLIPYHYPPWQSFHKEAWALLSFIAIGWAHISSQPQNKPAWIDIGVGLTIVVIWIQFTLQLIPYFGQAWINTLYILGFWLAYTVGKNSQNKEQIFNNFCSAVLFASLTSAIIQLLTWLQLNESSVNNTFILELAGDRPYGNIGQPNLLASLHLWGIISLIFFHQSKSVRLELSIAGIFILCLGLALANSRMSFLALLAISIFFFLKRKHLTLKPFLITLACLLTAYAFTIYLPIAKGILFLTQEDTITRLIYTQDIRIPTWINFAKESFTRPLFGFGMHPVTETQVIFAPYATPLNSLFAHTHNFVLEFFIWFGYPVGIILILILTTHVGFSALQKNNSISPFILAMVVTISIHSLLELPLHYSFFLMPFALLLGLINTPLKLSANTSIPKQVFFATLLFLTVGSIATAVDYFRVEEMYRVARFQKANIGNRPESTPEKALLLTEFNDRAWSITFDPKKSMNTPENTQRAELVGHQYGYAGLSYQIALAYALQNNQTRSLYWLKRICPLTSNNLCHVFKAGWDEQIITNPHIAFPTWPE